MSGRDRVDWDVGITLPIRDRIVDRDVLESMRNRGFQKLGIAVPPRFNDWPSSDEVIVFSRELSRLGLHVRSIHVSLHDENETFDTDPVQRARRIGSVNRAIDLLSALGGKICVVDVGAKADTARKGEEMLAVMRTAQSLSRIADQCQKKGLSIAIEAPARQGGSGDEDLLCWMMQQFPSVCLDLSRCSSNAGMLESLRRFAQRILQIQLSGPWSTDTTRLGSDGEEWKRCFDFFRSIRFRGAFMLEAPSTGDALADLDLAALHANHLFPEWVAERTSNLNNRDPASTLR
jgi:sugar phosphate isomerase/epimerase